MRARLLEIVRNQGLAQVNRWPVWNVLQNFDHQCVFNLTQYQKRKRLYEKLVKFPNKEVEDIVTKDVLRTERHLALFSDMDSIGTSKLFNVCKALGGFFPKIGYIQGMNFVVAFILEVSALEEFESFNFLVNFWKKRKYLFFGIYQELFPLVKFFQFSFHFFLNLSRRDLNDCLQTMGIPDELWLTKWFLSFYTIVLQKEFLVRVFDYIMVSDCMSLVEIALTIAIKLSPLILAKGFFQFASCVQSTERLASYLKFDSFFK